MQANSNSNVLSPGQVREASFSERLRHSKALIPTLAVLAVTTLALAATLVGQRTEALSAERAAQAAASPQAVVQSPRAQAQPTTLQPVAPRSVPLSVSPNPPVPAAVQPTPQPAVARPVCVTCGTVEAVTAVRRQGEVNGIGNSGVGIGAIGGAVVGGLLGNQVGGGNGKKAATVLGAVGGGYAGHAIEKNANSYTAYQMRVRMNDGTVRTIEQRSAVAAGSHVTVEGRPLRVVPVSSAQSMRQSDGGVRG
jgi:outer membrane lipoprotein SlyB